MIRVRDDIDYLEKVLTEFVKWPKNLTQSFG